MTRSLLLTLAWMVSLTGLMGQVAIFGDRIYTMDGPVLENGVVLVADGRILRVGPASQIPVPEGYQTYTARVVTPGLIDGRSVVGLSGKLNVPGDQQQLEKSAPVQPELRALDAYDAQEELIGYLRSQGVTTLHTGHAPGAPVSGQTMVTKTRPGFAEDVTLIPSAMLAMTLGNEVHHHFSSPGTRAKSVALLREELIKAQAYREKRAHKDPTKRGERDLRMEALVDLLEGRMQGLVYAQTAVDIQSAFRLAEEFGFPLVLDGAAEIYLFTDQLKASGARLILHPTMARANGDRKHLNLSTAAMLGEAGIPFSLQSGYEPYVPKTRVVRYEAAMAAAYGLDPETALRAITIHPASILGLHHRIGSITPGKDADLVLYNGDPLEHLTRVCQVFIDGQLVEDRCRD